MKATIVTIGDEILIGQIVDTNSSYIAKALDKIGIATHEMLSISDDKEHILNTFQKLQNEVEVVIITGGLGPTKDDKTKTALCQFLNCELVQESKILENFYIAGEVLNIDAVTGGFNFQACWSEAWLIAQDLNAK